MMTRNDREDYRHEEVFRMPRQHILGITAKRFKGRAFGEQTSYLRGLLRIAAQRGMRAYVFTLEDLDLRRRRVGAWVWTKAGWRRRAQPFPTVIYDRMWGLKANARQTFEDDLLDLNESEQIPFFNPYFGDKYDVHQRLMSEPSLHPHLPMTSPASMESVARLAQMYSSLYMKPVRGRQGKGIIRIDIKGDTLKITRQGTSRSHIRMTSSLEDAFTNCLKTVHPDDYIVQQGLDLLRVRGGTVDVRVIIQRNRVGVWQVSAIGCRIGPRGGFVSNLHAGGRAAGLTVLGPYLPPGMNVRQLRGSIETLALKTAEGMSEFFPTLGEIGLDLGVDRSGRLWILELNRQPGRALFSRAGLKKSWSRSRVRIVQFAKYLSQTYTPA